VVAGTALVLVQVPPLLLLLPLLRVLLPSLAAAPAAC
jgi:hypothetical protein